MPAVDIEIVMSQKIDWRPTERPYRKLMTQTCSSFMSLIVYIKKDWTYKAWRRQGRICISLHKLNRERSLHSGLLIPEGGKQRFFKPWSSPPLRCLVISVDKWLCGLFIAIHVIGVYGQTALRHISFLCIYSIFLMRSLMFCPLVDNAVLHFVRLNHSTPGCKL